MRGRRRCARGRPSNGPQEGRRRRLLSAKEGIAGRRRKLADGKKKAQQRRRRRSRSRLRLESGQLQQQSGRGRTSGAQRGLRNAAEEQPDRRMLWSRARTAESTRGNIPHITEPMGIVTDPWLGCQHSRQSNSWRSPRFTVTNPARLPFSTSMGRSGYLYTNIQAPGSRAFWKVHNVDEITTRAGKQPFPAHRNGKS